MDLAPFKTEKEIQALLEAVDPYNNQQITYSEVRVSCCSLGTTVILIEQILCIFVAEWSQLLLLVFEFADGDSFI